jgi:hypothetical protein
MQSAPSCNGSFESGKLHRTLCRRLCMVLSMVTLVGRIAVALVKLEAGARTAKYERDLQACWLCGVPVAGNSCRLVRLADNQ